jgi:hypothetical protein
LHADKNRKILFRWGEFYLLRKVYERGKVSEIIRKSGAGGAEMKKAGKSQPFSQDNRGGQAAVIAVTGQVSTHAPQSMQVSASITLFSPTSLMALVGQESSHAPQLMHSSVIT